MGHPRSVKGVHDPLESGTRQKVLIPPALSIISADINEQNKQDSNEGMFSRYHPPVPQSDPGHRFPRS